MRERRDEKAKQGSVVVEVVVRVVHVELKEANDFVARLHRHHKPVVGHRFSVGVEDSSGRLVGVAIVGRPVARKTDQRRVVEVLRLCTDGSRNACSVLYSACARAAKALGYEKIQTFILDSEPGTSLKASGWSLDGTSPGGNWNGRGGRARREDQPQNPKQRWAKTFVDETSDPKRRLLS